MMLHTHDIMSHLSLCFSRALSTTALTVDNVVRELRDITWYTLCSVLYLPKSQQHKIEKEHATEIHRKNAAVNFWLDNDPHASWRRLIIRLGFCEQLAVAYQIYNYAEKLTGT